MLIRSQRVFAELPFSAIEEVPLIIVEVVLAFPVTYGLKIKTHQLILTYVIAL
jgi:hypothetical protein